MCADGGHEDLGRRQPGQGEIARFGLHFSIGFPAGPDTPEGLQAWKFMLIRQTLSGNHRAGAGLLAAMPGLLVMRDRMVWRNLAETGPDIGQQRVLVGFQRQAIIAAASGDCCNRAAIAVQCRASAVTTLPLSAIRQSTSSAASNSPPWSAATVASVRRNRAA
jgi:hypothetical protein